MNNKSNHQDEFPLLTGPYLGQKPPGLIPELFAPGIVSTDDLEIEGVFSPTMDAFYFVRQRKGEHPKIHTIQCKDGVWQKTAVEERHGELAISTDGKTMFLGNQCRNRTASGWSEIKSLGPQFENFPIMRLTASAANTYVFDEREEFGLIRYSRLIDGQHEAPQPFGNEINSGRLTAHPFIAPDESYLIWDSEREGGYGRTDLYISFRQKDGSWGPAINLGDEINSENQDIYGSVTPDGKYFFFSSLNLEEGKANIFWVDAQALENLRNK